MHYRIAQAIAEWKAKLDKKRLEEQEIAKAKWEEEKKLLPKPKSIAQEWQDMITENKAKWFFKGTFEDIKNNKNMAN